MRAYMNIIAESHTQQHLTFSSLTNDQLTFKLVHSAHIVDQDRPYIQLKLETNTAHLSHIFEKQWFHYSSHVLLHDVAFNKQDAITITLVLSPSIAAQLFEKQYELEHVLALLFNVNKDGLRPINEQELWFLVEGKQKQTLPTDLLEDEESYLAVGFKTSWFNQLVMDPSPVRPKTEHKQSDQTLLEKVVLLLESEMLSYTIAGDDVYIELNYDGISWTEIIRTNEVSRLVTCYANFSDPVPQDKRLSLALVLMNENYSLANGAFELDHEDGDLRFRTTLICPSALDFTQLAQILSDHIDIMKHYTPAVKQYILTS